LNLQYPSSSHLVYANFFAKLFDTQKSLLEYMHFSGLNETYHIVWIVG